MKTANIRRIHRKSTAAKDSPTFRKEGQKESTFFGEATQDTFFQPAPITQRPNKTSIDRSISYDECTSAEQTIVYRAHYRAIGIVATAISKLLRYNGATPVEVHTALNTHFHGTSVTLARWLAANLVWLANQVDGTTYECEKKQAGNTLGESMWCVPFTDIVLYPKWFLLSTNDLRAATIIHEWVHRYGCNFDLGYRDEPGYAGHSTFRSLFNADTWSELCYDIR